MKNNQLKIKVKKLHPDAVIPKKAHSTDAGFDLTAVSCKWDADNEVFSYGFGLSFEIPEGYVGLIFPRSSVFRKDLLLSNAVGVIDSGYRGEVSAKFKTTKEVVRRYVLSERVAQMIILPYPEVSFTEVDELPDSDRGNGGYGSTGK